MQLGQVGTSLSSMSDDTGRVKSPAKPKQLSHDPRRLKRRRIIAGFSQVNAASAAGCSKSNICKLEHGAYGASPELLAALAELYECRAADVMPARYAALMARFAQEADPDGQLTGRERDIRAINLLADYLRYGEPEANGEAA